MNNKSTRSIVEREIESNDGVLRLEPAWVARDFLPPGRRLGLPDSQYELGERGGICERWVGSTTPADNAVKVENEGLSVLSLGASDETITLKKAVEEAPELILGENYANSHDGLGRLPKIFDYKWRLPYHLHQMEHHAKLVGCNSKEEAYYFPEGVDPGPQPVTFFGVHPYIAAWEKYDLLLDALKEWKDDSILRFARGYKQYPGDGFHVPSGTLHAPGSALTIELQEDSDVFAMLQAKVEDCDISKDLLYKDVREEEREQKGEAAILEMVNWEISGDPYFYENRHTPPIEIDNEQDTAAREYWIFYNTTKFSGKKLVIPPGETFISRDNGVYNILVWQGKGTFHGFDMEAGNFGQDELLVCHSIATKEIEVVNTGKSDLMIYKFFGPDVNKDVPMLEKYPKE
ncbi:MAG: hypothetical protein K9N46_05335 [Candidatus Marinimicrobia bacterium]|nr:hypothetical protein [Candidatus Neomarinimicrobiota bacterium]MCF7880145.1 hypothetical protein [Candidatus Neomarinimicrobiota bacterium]